MARDRYKFGERHAVHFLTCTAVAWLPLFSRPAAAQIILDSLKYLQEQKRLILYAYVIMENRLHYLASADALAKQNKEFKSYTARKIIDMLEVRNDRAILDSFSRLKQQHHTHCDYQVWEEGSYPVELTTDVMVEQKMHYIHDNPVRRGYVDRPEDWRYTSARNYCGMTGLIPVTVGWKGEMGF